MILPLRRSHRRIIAGLALVVPFTFAIAVGQRQSIPYAHAVSSAVRAEGISLGKVLSTKTDLWGATRILTLLRQAPGRGVAVELMKRDLIGPDLLLYWVPGASTPQQSLPENARLLGAVADAKALLFPEDERGRAGRLLLYSLADQQIAAVSKAFAIQKQ